MQKVCKCLVNELQNDLISLKSIDFFNFSFSA